MCDGWLPFTASQSQCYISRSMNVKVHLEVSRQPVVRLWTVLCRQFDSFEKKTNQKSRFLLWLFESIKSRSLHGGRADESRMILGNPSTSLEASCALHLHTSIWRNSSLPSPPLPSTQEFKNQKKSFVSTLHWRKCSKQHFFYTQFHDHNSKKRTLPWSHGLRVCNSSVVARSWSTTTPLGSQSLLDFVDEILSTELV